jgi:phenylalanyl-tRNA synthetase alpha chain
MADRTDAQKVVLHPMERLVLRSAAEKRRATFKELAEELGMKVDAVAKAAERLQMKGLVRVEEVVVDRVAELSGEAKEYAVRGLPERRLVEELRRRGGSAELEELKEALGEKTVEIGIIWAKRNGWIEVSKSEGRTILRLARYPDGPIDEERVLESLVNGLRSLAELGTLASACERLARRAGLVTIREVREHLMTLTEEGISLAGQIEEVEEVSQLTPELIKTGKWRSVRLARYDVYAPVKPVFTAREHPLTSLIRKVREAFVELGFQEVKGPLVELAFWNFDALFQPQDHPAREMHDTFYLAWPERGKVPEGLAERVKADEASRLILRTHTTATTIRYLAEHREPPVKVFSVDRIFRNERVNWKRLSEFHQIEGILMDKDVGLKHLMGVIKEFYARLGLREVRFRPSYFPYTEPSAEVDVYLKDLGRWVELGGMGVFRPEVTRPLGVVHPVLAWGLGLERLAIIVYGVEDIRELYRNDLSWIRSVNPIDLR